MRNIRRHTRGQSSVEAALIIPLLFSGILLLVQPGIILYDKLIMDNAAYAGCRAMITQSQDISEQDIIAFVKRRLGAIPSIDWFHVHNQQTGECSYSIHLSGNSHSEKVTVSISTRITLLPIIGMAGSLLNLTNTNGELLVETSASLPTQPSWVSL